MFEFIRDADLPKAITDHAGEPWIALRRVKEHKP